MRHKVAIRLCHLDLFFLERHVGVLFLACRSSLALGLSLVVKFEASVVNTLEVQINISEGFKVDHNFN